MYLKKENGNMEWNETMSCIVRIECFSILGNWGHGSWPHK
jgi:hypothetical protein